MSKILVVCDKSEKSVSLQQIPKELKSLFPSKEGYSYVSIDAGQCEYRVFGSLSQDKALIDALNAPGDFYKAAGEKIFGIPSSEITAEKRDQVKTCFLGVLYGMRSSSLASRLKISEYEAQKLMDKWNQTFPQAAAFKQNCINYIRKTGKSPAYFGRYRDFGDPAKLTDDMINEGFNTLIQSTAADLIKVAMVMTSKHLNESGSGTLKNTMHDELIFEVKDESLNDEMKNLEDIMAKSMKLRNDWCDFKFHTGSGKTWGEASKD